MGNTFSNNSESRDLNTLQSRIDKLELAADLDGDGLVTKKELKEYAAKELELKDSEILLLRTEKTRLEKQVADLKVKAYNAQQQADKELDRLQSAYDTLHMRHEQYLEMIAKDTTQDTASNISTKAIDRFVDELLADPNINIYMLPDTIEKPLYANTLKIMLSVVQKMFNNTNLDIIGHEFKMNMQPTLETRLEDTKSD